MRQDILTGGRGNIIFPVTSVNGYEGDVHLTAADFGLGDVDNTRDIDKPLSIPQRAAILNMLEEYDHNIDLSMLTDHILNHSNPHGIKVDDLDVNGELEKYVQRLINRHNYSTADSTHLDIRRSLSKLWIQVDDQVKKLDTKIKSILDELRIHYEDPFAHYDLFVKKEDVENKAKSFTEEDLIDHSHYPSTRAVADYVREQLATFRKSIPNITTWISDIQVVNTRANLPEPTERYYRSTYIIRKGERSFEEIAVCRYKEDEEKYYWDITETGSYTRLDPTHFVDSANGLRINLGAIVLEMLNQDGVLESTVRDIMSEYYTKKEIDEKHFISDLVIAPGTMDGTIRFYINDDPRTMSSDIRVTGLQRLAFLEYVTEDQIWDHAVHTRHILNKAIITRHIQDKAVTPKKIACRPGYVIANIDDLTGEAHEIPINQFLEELGLTGTGGQCECNCTEIDPNDVDDMWDSVQPPVEPDPPQPPEPEPPVCECEPMVELTREQVDAMYKGEQVPATQVPDDYTHQKMVEFSEESLLTLWEGGMPDDPIVPGEEEVG
ncbi:MAG: hypothetical protein K2N48_12220, partial [Muribaculaceae bacterium]|nr:hypothetical protein [Muribaculaceae bacterium]